MVADSLPPYGWNRNTHFKLALVNQLDGNKSVVKETQQKFNGGYRSWGSFFVNLSDFYDSKQGYLLNDTCIIEAHVCFSDLSTLEANNLKKITPTKDSKSGDQAARNSESTQQGDDKEAETEIETEISDESETFSSSTCGSSETEWEIQSSDLTLKDLLDLASLGKEEAACVPLLEEACIWHPSLIRSQRKSSRWFKLWAFTSLGQVLHLLKTSKVKDMNEEACNRLQGLWEELVKHSGFQLSWLEPYVQSALDMKTHLDKTDEVNKLKDSVVALEIKMKKLREELVAAEAEFEVARRALAEARKGFIEMDLNADLATRMDNKRRPSINFETFTWKIENFSRQNTNKLKSKAFQIRGYKWQIRLYPLVKNVDHFSLHLMVADSLPPYGWDRNTYFKLALINQLDGSKSVVKETEQKFKGGFREWGSFFVNLSDFYDPKQGYLVNDTCIIEAHVCVSDLSTLQANNLSIITPTNDLKFGDQSARHSETSEGEVQGSDLTLRDLLDLECLAKEGADFVPLLEEACIWHPSLIRSQSKSSKLFKQWAFTSLGEVLHVLKISKVKDMNEDAFNHLQGLWEELVKRSGFQLSWLEPYVQSALAMKAQVEKAAEVNKLKDNVVDLEVKMKKLRGELKAAEAEFEVARRALAEARKGFIEIEVDLNAELGYAMF
ncbi:hypothetical protein JHK82_054220 [Glycine max]|nr:hypothetical protein JHK82_054220 [Glycine max]